MIKKSLLFAALLFTATSFAQINFEKGYYIDNTGTRHEAMIRNADWSDNPRRITVKLTEDDQQLEKTIDEIQEFSIPGAHKFVRADVDIDRSESAAGEKLSGDKNPTFRNERLFFTNLG